MEVDFKVFSKAVHKNYDAMSKKELFVVDVANIFDSYLAAFPAGTNPLFKERTVYDCNCCKQFIRKLGVLVAINADGTRETVWDDLNDLPTPFKEVAARMSELIQQAPIRTVFRTKERMYGTEYNFGSAGDKDRVKFEHFHGRVADKHYSADAATKRGEIESVFQVFKRGLEEINSGDLEQVVDLIDSNTLYRGEEHRASVIEFQKLKKAFDGTDAFVWANINNRNARFRNTVIGTLLVDLAEGKDLEFAVKGFETKVAPVNYKRPTALITQRMVDDAAKALKELNLEGAIHRRFARLGDVSVNNVLFVDNSVAGQMKDGIAGLLKDSVKAQAINVKNATPITVDDFLKTIVPGSTSMAVLVENKHLGNFVSLTCGDGNERLFRWDNNFAWSYDGEVTDSIKARVKAAGGNVNALLRVSLGWFNWDDLDIHCRTPDRVHIHYANKCDVLDVDMNAAGRRDSRTPVENLAFNHLRDGVYRVFVNNYMKKESVDIGFSIEVEFAGAVHEFSYNKAVANQANVEAVSLTVKNGQLTKIEPGPGLVGGSVSNERWGITTESLVPVHVLLNSPNHWDGQGVGSKHTFFMLKGCKNPDPARGIYNEFLRADLEKHRKVFEVLGSKTKCPPTEDQISGVGFTSARGDTVTIVVDGRRAYNVTF